MIWILIAAIAITIFLLLATHKGKGNEMPYWYIGAAVLIGLIIYLGGNGGVATTTTPDYTIAKDTKIASLKTNSLIQGSFVLGTGHIDQEPYYFYLEMTAQGGYKLAWSPAKNATIYERSQPNGQVVEYHPTLRSSIWSLDYPNKIDIYIPEGSIIKEYSP